MNASSTIFSSSSKPLPLARVVVVISSPTVYFAGLACALNPFTTLDKKRTLPFFVKTSSVLSLGDSSFIACTKWKSLSSKMVAIYVEKPFDSHQ